MDPQRDVLGNRTGKTGFRGLEKEKRHERKCDIFARFNFQAAPSTFDCSKPENLRVCVCVQ